MNPSKPIVLLGVAALGAASILTACSSSEPAACDAPPSPGTALGARPQQIWENSQYVNASYDNATYANQMYENGVWTNVADGSWVNGVSLNFIYNNLITDNAAGSGNVAMGPAHLEKTHVVLANGEELRAGGKVQVVFSNGKRIDIDVATRVDDPKDSSMVRYTLTYQGKNVCGEGRDGIFVPGTWDPMGARHDDRELVTFACFPGAIAKCVLWGYRPWQEGIETHQACTRLVRADYCGDGASHTRNGTPIDVFDALGVNAPASTTMRFEAAWGPDGATCVGNTRYTDTQNGQVLLPTCWASKPKCASWAEAQTQGAKLANASNGTPRQVCGR